MIVPASVRWAGRFARFAPLCRRGAAIGLLCLALPACARATAPAPASPAPPTVARFAESGTPSPVGPPGRPTPQSRGATAAASPRLLPILTLTPGESGHVS